MPEPPADPLIGHDIGEYRITGVLGRGGMGIVYAADDTNLGIPVALKMIDPALARDASFVRRFRAEARAMARIQSPHIVRVMAMRQTEHGLFLVMECVDGGTLYDRMSAGSMAWNDAWPVIRQMLLALEKAHAVGVIHRDIKPRNVMLTRDGTVKVTDFGLAKDVSGDSSATVTQAVAGTLLYMSPEQVRASPTLDARSDLFALGLTAYEMLAGRLPFERDAGEFAVMRAIAEEAFPPPTKFAPSVPDRPARVLMKALEKDPDKRYASAAALREAFEAALPETASARTATRVKPLAQPGGSRRIGLIAAAAVLGLLLAAGLVWWMLPSEPALEPNEPVAEQTLPMPPRPEAETGAETDSDPEPLDAQEDSPSRPEARTEPRAETPAPQTAPQPGPAASPEPVAQGTLSVAARSGVIYRAAGRRVEGSQTLPVGAHTVECEAGGQTASTRVIVQPNEATSVSCIAEQIVNVSAAFEDAPSSWATVWVNGESRGQTPTRLTLGAGTHRVSVSRDGFESITGEQIVTVRPSFETPEPQRLAFRLRPSN